MTKPMPLTAYGPLTPISPSARVSGVLSGAEVTIFDNGNQIGKVTSAITGELIVKLSIAPIVGHTITAIQKTMGGTSLPSTQPVIVVALPDPLPTPVILSALNTCMVDIWAGALVPGAKVITEIGGSVFGNITADQTRNWLGINSTQSIPTNSQIRVHQEAVSNGTTHVGPAVVSPNIPSFTNRSDLLPPVVLGPLMQCATEILFQQAVPGALTRISNEGQDEVWINSFGSYLGYGGQPLRAGTAVAVQEMPRCKRVGQPVTLQVSAASTPPAPLVSLPLCPQTRRVTVSGLVPGGVLHVARRVSGSTGMTESAIGDLGIAYETQIVDLPSDLALNDPNGPVMIAFTQERCAGISSATIVTIASFDGHFTPPRITEPLIDCARFILINGAHSGSIVQIFEAASGVPLSDPIVIISSDSLLELWFPLKGGQKVLARQKGCNADGDSQSVTVRPLPQPIPNPTIATPVRPQAAVIKVSGIIPGARLYLLVNGELRPGSISSYVASADFPVTGAPLNEKDQLFVIQKICDQSSNSEGHNALVVRGNLKVQVTPPIIARGTTSSVTVVAIDADTGAPVSADILLNNHHVGTTGNPFSYSPSLTDTNPSGLVHDGASYNDAPFTLSLTDPVWSINLRAGPVPAFLSGLEIKVTKVTWVVTPDWNAGGAKTIAVTPNPPSAAGSATLDKPTGSIKTVTVAISGTCATNGGIVNGIPVPAQSFPLGTDSRKVAFQGTDETIGWLLNVEYVYDPTTEVLRFGVVPVLQGISP